MSRAKWDGSREAKGKELVTPLQAPSTQMPQTARRISYVIPSPTSPPPYLDLPQPTHPRNGSPHPILIPSPAGQTPNVHSTQPESHPQHHLGVSALALDTSTLLSGKDTPQGILYTGGRDGLVASWELGVRMKKRFVGSREDKVRWNEMDDGDWEDEMGEREEKEEEDVEEEVKWKKLPWEDRWEVDVQGASSIKPPVASFRQCMQYHTDWVNDIVLCNLNQTLISASSDRTIRAWSPHNSTPDHQPAPTIIGTHTDYVHSLTHSKHAAWVASGGFDRKIKLWDISHGSLSSSTSFASGAAKVPEPILVLGGSEEEDERKSVYSLATNISGALIVSGGPDKVVRMWDPRAGGKEVGQLSGHTENVRALCLSEDGKFLLSGSSDTTVKLWSLSAQRVIHTFTHHSASITSLFSSHRNLERFYTGDLSGHVSVVDLERCADISDGECISLLHEGGSSCPEGEKSPLANKGSMGINKIVALDDQYLWTATSSSNVNLWKDVGRRIRRSPGFRPVDRSSSPGSSEGDGVMVDHEDDDEEGTREGRERLLAEEFTMQARTFTPPTSAKNSPRNSWHAGGPSPSQLLTAAFNQPSILKPPSQSGKPTAFLPSQLPEEDVYKPLLNGVPYESLVNLSPHNPYGFSSIHHHIADPDQTTLYSTASILSLPNRSKFQPVPPNRAVSPAATTKETDELRPTPTMLHPDLPPITDGPERGARFDLPLSRDADREARLDFQQRDVVGDAVCVNQTGPVGVIAGTHGLVRSLMFSDRQHVVTCDTAGVIAVWNIVFCKCIGLISSVSIVEAHNSMSLSPKPITPRDALELVKERMEGDASIPTWCSVNTKIGGLTVSLERGRCFDAEIHLDELAIGGLQGDFKEDQRVSLGKLLLANLFAGFIEAEVAQRSSRLDPSEGARRAPPAHIRMMGSQPNTPGGILASSSLATPGMTAALAPTDDASGPSPRKDYFSKQVMSSNHLAVPSTPGGGSTTGPDTPFSPGVTVQTPGGSFMGKFKGFGKGKKPPVGMTLNLPANPLLEEDVRQKDGQLTTPELEQQRLLDFLFSTPLCPPNTTEVPPIPSLTDATIVIDEESKNAGAWAVTYRGSVTQASQELNTLEMALPDWVLEFLLAGRIPNKETVKLSFLLEPFEKGPKGMGEMPNGNSRLTANRALRVRKICAYVLDRLNVGQPISSTPPSPTQPTRPTSSHPSSTSLSSADSPPEQTVKPEEMIELVCNGMVLPNKITLAAVKHFVWRQGGDVVLLYRLKKDFESAQFQKRA